MMLYNFSEKLVLNVHHPSSTHHYHGRTSGITNAVQVDVLASTNATIILQQAHDDNESTASSFPLLIKDVLLQYSLQRLVIQSASESISSSSPASHVKYLDDFNFPPNIGTPIGISIFARFVLPEDDKNETKRQEELQLQNSKFIMLLRTLNTYNLISCGATPFSSLTTSSILQQKHDPSIGGQRFNHLQFPNPIKTTSTTADFRIILPMSNDVGTFICHDNFESFLALSSPCYSKATAVGILGTCGLTSEVLHATPRKHLWIDASSTPSCFDNRKYDSSLMPHPCTLSLSQGISYTKYLNQAQQQFGRKGREPVSFSLNQLLLQQGNRRSAANMQQQQQQLEKASLLKPCPFATSSDIITIIHSSSSPPFFIQHEPNELKILSDKKTLPIISSLSKHSLLALLPNINDKISKNGGAATVLTGTSIDMGDAWIAFNYSASKHVSMLPNRITDKTSWGIKRIHKYLSGSSRTNSVGVGKLQTCVFNGDDKFPVQASVTDYFPNTMIYPLLHTSEFWLHQGGCAGDFTTFPRCQDPDADNTLIAPTYTSTKLNFASRSNNYISDYHFFIAPTSGATLELTLQLPPDSSLCLSMEYSHRFLSFDFFPADPNRGIDIPPSFATFSCPNCTTATRNTTLFASSLLLLPPSPDMTMPFNVISLTSTIYAFIIGSVMNILIRRSSASINKALGKPEEDAKSKIKKMVVKFKEKIKLFWNKDSKVKDE
jgi:hypothetical protein